MKETSGVKWLCPYEYDEYGENPKPHCADCGEENPVKIYNDGDGFIVCEECRAERCPDAKEIRR